MIKGTTRDHGTLARAIRRRERFETSGALHGEYNGISDTYTVWSYREPIAVVFFDRATDTAKSALVTTRKWSVTTSKHQGTTRRALANLYVSDITETSNKMFAHSDRTL